MQAYANAPFFTLTNYEQMVVDSLNVNEHLKPDVVVLSAEEEERLNGLRAQVQRKLKMARLLAAGGLEDETRAR